MSLISEKIIPAIDIIGGQCVRLTQGDYGRKKAYGRDIVEVALEYEAVGLRRLHCIDLDGAKAGRPVNLAALERLASATSMRIEWGGGMGSEEALRRAFGCGAAKVVCGSAAERAPGKFAAWLREFGSGRIILGADVRGERVAVHGWTEDSETTIVELIDRFLPEGLAEVICTDIGRDGMLQGPAFGLYRELACRYPGLGIIASGGVSSVGDILKLLGRDGTEAGGCRADDADGTEAGGGRENNADGTAAGGCRADDAGADLAGRGVSGVIVGKALYEGRISLDDLRKIISNTICWQRE